MPSPYVYRSNIEPVTALEGALESTEIVRSTKVVEHIEVVEETEVIEHTELVEETEAVEDVEEVQDLAEDIEENHDGNAYIDVTATEKPIPPPKPENLSPLPRSISMNSEH